MYLLVDAEKGLEAGATDIAVPFLMLGLTLTNFQKREVSTISALARGVVKSNYGGLCEALAGDPLHSFGVRWLE